MKKNVQFLLAADAVINLLLGILILSFPAGVLRSFGLPTTDTYFYTSILGGVIFGIGLALMQECLREGKGSPGLGLVGAIAINLTGGGTLLYWLLFEDLSITTTGLITLWIIAVLVIGIGLVELINRPWIGD